MSASDTVPGGSFESRALSVDVIEDLGLGPAQLRTVLLAGAVPLGMGCHLAALSLVMASVAKEFNLGEIQQSLLTVLVYAGILLGALAGGRLGDSRGRRCAIALSTLMSAAFGFLAALSLCWPLFLFCFLALGVAMGVGLPATCALVSEVTPEVWRSTTRAACDILFDVGFIFVALVATCQDPVLYDLKWRPIVAWASFPSFVLGPLVVLLLGESPAFLAATSPAAARSALVEIARFNGVEQLGVDIRLPSKVQAARTPSGVLSERFLGTTLVVAYAAFVLNIFYTSGTYLLSQVQVQGSHDLVGGWQMIGSGGADILILGISAWFVRHLPRSVALEISLISAAIAVWCFAAGLSAGNRSLLTEMARQSGVLGFYWVPPLGFLSLYQTAVEAYPANSASTGAAVVLAAGRLGAIITPDVLSRFQAMTGHVHSVCYFIGLACALGVALVHVILPRHGVRAMEDTPLLLDQQQRKAATSNA